MRNHLRFVKQYDPYGLDYEVFEAVYHRPFGKPVVQSLFYSGQLGFSTGAREGWWFISCDDSIKWFLGPRVRDAMKELRRRYLGEQRKSKAKRSGRKANLRRNTKRRKGSARAS